MSTGLMIAGSSSLALAAGHAATGRWVLPNFREDAMSATPFGPPRETVGMARFTWHVVTLLLTAMGVLLLMLALMSGVDVETLLLRWISVFWFASAATALWLSRRTPGLLLGLPGVVTLVCLLVGVLSWRATL